MTSLKDRVFALPFAFVLAITCLLFTGCVTPPHKEFARAKLGMDKGTVLEVAGSPKVTTRWQGKDRWIYDFPNHPDGPQTREIHFENGRAVYIGNKIAPQVTAEEVDLQNEQSNKEEAKRLAEEQAYYELQTGAVRVNPDPKQVEASRASVDEFYNGTVNLSREKSKRAPEYVPVQ